MGESLPILHSSNMSRYPSAHGHTPGYKSITSSTYPSALDTTRRVDMDLGLSGGLGGRTSSSLLGSNIDRELSSLSVILSLICSCMSLASSISSDQSLY